MPYFAVVFYYISEELLKEEIESVSDDGSTLKMWLYNGVLSREDGPSRIILGPGGETLYLEWCLNGKTHRIDGPAITIDYEGERTTEWWIDGNNFSLEEFLSNVPEENVPDIAYYLGETGL